MTEEHIIPNNNTTNPINKTIGVHNIMVKAKKELTGSGYTIPKYSTGGVVDYCHEYRMYKVKFNITGTISITVHEDDLICLIPYRYTCNI